MKTLYCGLIIGLAWALTACGGDSFDRDEIPSSYEKADNPNQQEFSLGGEEAEALLNMISKVVHVPADQETGERAMRAPLLSCSAFGGEQGAQFICQIQGEEAARFSGTLAEELFFFLKDKGLPMQMVVEGTLVEVKNLTCDTMQKTLVNGSSYLSTSCHGIMGEPKPEPGV